MKPRLALSALALCLLIACGPSDLERVSKGLNALATATSIAQTNIIEMHAQQLIGDDTARPILEAFLKVNQAQKEAVAITKQLSKFDQPTAQQLLLILNPIVASLDTLVKTGAVGIDDPETKQRVHAILVLVQANVTTLQLLLAGS